MELVIYIKFRLDLTLKNFIEVIDFVNKFSQLFFSLFQMKVTNFFAVKKKDVRKITVMTTLPEGFGEF